MRQVQVENITKISLTDAVKAMKFALSAEKSDRNAPRQIPLLLGPPGQGKTAIVDGLAASLNDEREREILSLIEKNITRQKAEEAVGAEWSVVNYRLIQCDPTDLKGVPLYQTVDGIEMSANAPPQWFPIIGVPNSAKGKNVIIFLDELPQAPSTLQNLAANICDGKIGDYLLDFSRCFIVAAGNRKEDRAATFEIPTNVGNRSTALSVLTTFAEWEDWAMKNNISPLVIGFLKANQTVFNQPPPEDSFIFATPRSWHRLSTLLKSMGTEEFLNPEGVGLAMAQGSVGVAVATQFYQFVKTAYNEFSVDDIVEGRRVKIPTDKQKDILFSIMLECANRINTWVAEAVSSAGYQGVLSKMPSQEERSKAFITALGNKKVNYINNIYKWISSEQIDPAWKILINKYQSSTAQGQLRYAIMTHPDFEETSKSYLEITKKLGDIQKERL